MKFVKVIENKNYVNKNYLKLILIFSIYYI